MWGAVNKLKVGFFRQEACAGAPAPPGWNVRSARVFGCRFRTVMDQDCPDSIFSQLPGEGLEVRGRAHGRMWVTGIESAERRTTILNRRSLCLSAIVFSP